MCHIRIARLVALACVLALPMPSAQAQTGPIEQNFTNSLTALPTEALTVSGAFYVPVYSSVSMSQGKLRADFSVTLSVHNASETRPLVGGVGSGYYAFVSQGRPIKVVGKN